MYRKRVLDICSILERQFPIASVNHYKCTRTCYTSSPRITVPQKLVSDIIRKASKPLKSDANTKIRRNNKAPIISCRNKKLDHYPGQKYHHFGAANLASNGWKNTRSKGDYFTINSRSSNPSLQDRISFSDLGLDERLIKALNSVEIEIPTSVQVNTLPYIAHHRNVLCTAETGSGKTLAYLLPIMERILSYKDTYSLKPNRPYCVILVPSRELANQINRVCEQLYSHTNITHYCLNGGSGTQELIRSDQKFNCEILVSTPGVLKRFDLSKLYHFVIDEADTLLDDSFSRMTLRLLNKIKLGAENSLEQIPLIEERNLIEENRHHEMLKTSKLNSINNPKDSSKDNNHTDNRDPEDNSTDDIESETIHQNFSAGTQVSLVSATMPTKLKSLLGDIIPMDSLEVIESPHLHHVMPHVSQRFNRVGNDQKPEALLRALKRSRSADIIPTIIFCNKWSTCCFVGHFLTSNDISNVIVHANMPQKARDGKFDEFREKKVSVLVTTDVMSRGMDTNNARHIINYDFPDYISDYIHRVGRVGRVSAGKARTSTGFVVNFISEKWNVDLLWSIESSARSNTSFVEVNANIKQEIKRKAQEIFL